MKSLYETASPIVMVQSVPCRTTGFLPRNKKRQVAAAKEVGMGNPAEKNDRSPDSAIVGEHPPMARNFWKKIGKVRLELRKIRLAHQVTIALAGSAPTFVESPDHKTLAAPAIASGEDSLNIR
jgi:hypothetical protein